MRYDPLMHEIGPQPQMLSPKVFRPSQVLQPVVQNYFLLTNENLFSNHSDWHILPDNCAHLIFYLFDRGNTIEAKWHLIGPRSKHKIINRKDRLFTFASSFQPGGLSPFVNVPMSELRDQPTQVDLIFNHCEREAFAELTKNALEMDIDQFIPNLESFLLSSCRIPKVHKAVSGLYKHYQTSPGLKLQSMAKKLGYSERHLRNLTREHIGHPPKMVTKIERFASSLRKSNHSSDWADIAYASGYYDQSHMISDFQELAGNSPERLLL